MNGPSLTSETCMCGAEEALLDAQAVALQGGAERLHERLGHFRRGRVGEKPGRRPREVSAYSVNCLTTSNSRRRRRPRPGWSCPARPRSSASRRSCRRARRRGPVRRPANPEQHQPAAADVADHLGVDVDARRR